ncbi:IS30 family transposase [Nesterenkonia ebinurensis]|uniref:IS30 family transposase n=1 Tax=Nesterenkonia ebinurensis TaxID=2608252 RepID=UPI00123CC660|nr:IS30 family transposase [Nesterenkonia ebinurensis]
MVCQGATLGDAAVAVGGTAGSGKGWWPHTGMVRLRRGRHQGGGIDDPAPDDGMPGGRLLTLGDRMVIQLGRRQGMSYAAIGAEIGRDKSVVYREVARNSSPDGAYYARVAHTRTHQRRHRPKPFTLAENTRLCQVIEEWMDEGWSPKLISVMLPIVFGDDQTMRVSHETIYQALYVQTRGNLRADLHQRLSLKRRSRVSKSAPRVSNSPFKEAFKISQRPAEVADRAVPGHWEGDLIIGGGNHSAIGTLVERASRFTILLHLPGKYNADVVAQAMITAMRDLPAHLRRSVTWDRGSELARYEKIQLALDAQVFFCDPHSPWQRGTNENTNQLLRHWFAKGSDLTGYTATDLRRIQDTLNRRPRPTLDLHTPANRLAQFLHTAA